MRNPEQSILENYIIEHARAIATGTSIEEFARLRFAIEAMNVLPVQVT